MEMLKKTISTRREGRVQIDSDWQPVAVTAQFLENAETYHARYYNNDYWKYLVGKALDHSCVDRQASLRVLDIGSGSGNTVFAAAELMPNSVICANDISPQLLQILVGIQDHMPHLTGRIEAYCFDLHKDFFADNTFDLVIGGAILHHMLNPKAALKNTARWLRPGGKILLIEPLEIGGHIMTAIYLTLSAELELELDVDPRLLLFFKAMCQDYEARFGVPRVKPWTCDLDDKWLFHQSYLREMAGEIGLTLEQVVPTDTNMEKVFSNAVRGTLKGAGLAGVPTPERLWEILELFDVGISEDLKKRLTPSGIIILTKTAEEDESAEILYNKIQGIIKEDRLCEAVTLFENLITSRGDEPLWHNDLGCLHYALGDMPAARDCFEKAVRLDSTLLVALKNLADFYSSVEGRIEEAIELYHKVLAQSPDDIETKAAIGQLCTHKGHISDEST
jgi:SAM-dependent methyltransferase